MSRYSKFSPQYLEQIAVMLKKADERYAEQQRDPNPLADKLIEACAHGRLGEVQWLLHKKLVLPDVVRSRGTPIGSAVMSPIPHELLNELVRASANLNLQDQNGWCALFISAANDRFEVVRRLLELGADANLPCPSNGWTALMNAACSGCNRSVIELLAYGADLDLKSLDNLTALDIAKANGHVSTVRVFNRYIDLKKR